MDKIKSFFKTTGSLFKTNTGNMIFVIVATFLLTLLLFGGGGKTAEPERPEAIPAGQTETVDTPTETPAETPTTPAETASAGNLGDYYVEIKDYEITKDYEGKSAIVITFGFANYKEDPQSFDWSIMSKAFQNGLQLDTAYIEGLETDKEILSGYSTDAKKAFLLQDTTSPVLVTCEELISLDSAKIEKTFNIA